MWNRISNGWGWSWCFATKNNIEKQNPQIAVKKCVLYCRSCHPFVSSCQLSFGLYGYIFCNCSMFLLQVLESRHILDIKAQSHFEAPPSELCELCRRRLLPSTSSSGSNTDSTGTASHKRWVGDVSKPNDTIWVGGWSSIYQLNHSWSTSSPKENPVFLMENPRGKILVHLLPWPVASSVDRWETTPRQRGPQNPRWFFSPAMSGCCG